MLIKKDEKSQTDFFYKLLNLYVLPEIKNRQETGELSDPFRLDAAQIIFFPDNKKRIIRLNQEVKAIADVVYKNGISKKKGENVSNNELEEIKKITLTNEDDPDCAHVFLIHIEKKWVIYFDLRYNKKLASDHIKRASEFIKSAEYNYQNEHMGPFIDNLFSASELLAKSILLLALDPKLRKKSSHYVIKDKFNRFVSLGNLESEYSNILNTLERLRPKGRYLQGTIEISDIEAENYLESVKKLKIEAEKRVGLT